MVIILIVLAVLIILALRSLIPMMYSAKGNEAYTRGDVKTAMEYYKKAAASGKASHKTSYALILMREGEFRQAETIFNEIVLDPKAAVNDRLSAKLYRCMLYEKTDRLNEALEDAEEIYERMKTTSVYGALGYLRQLKGGAELDFCMEAYDYNSDDRDICDNLVVAYIRSGELDKAEEVAEGLREKYPTFLEGFYHSAIIAKMRGDKGLAKEFLEESQNCTRNVLTTISEEEINLLREELENA